jgi:2-methylcitrate dehydratase PrpD
VSGYTARLAEFASGFDFDQLPADVLRQAKAVILDTLGAQLAASSPRYAASRILGEFARANGGTPVATLIGRGSKTSVVDAALVNATLGYYCDIEPHHPGAIMHGAAIVVPAAMAACEARGLGGREWIAAVVLGWDMACRASYAIGQNALYDRGFHPTAVAGTFGAAACVGNLYGLDAERMANALGLAATQASGLLAWASDHTEQSRPFNPGIAARNGATAALLAHGGFAGPRNVFDPDQKYNVYRAWSAQPRPEELIDRLHDRYFVMEVAYKLYASCAFLHPALDAIMQLLEEGEVVADEVMGIVLRFSHTGRDVINDNPLKSHCAQYILPIGLFNRQVVIDDILFEPRDERIGELQRRVLVIGDDELERAYPIHYPSIVELTLRDGRVARRRVDWPRGYPQNPLSQAEIEEKFMGLATTGLDERRAAELIELVGHLETLDTLAPIVERLVTVR